MALISVGIDHENASLDLLERATVLEHEWGKVLRTPGEPAQHSRGRLRLDLPAHRSRRGHRPFPRRDRRDHPNVGRGDGSRAQRVRGPPERQLRTRCRDSPLQRRGGPQVRRAGGVRDPGTTSPSAGAGRSKNRARAAKSPKSSSAPSRRVDECAVRRRSLAAHQLCSGVGVMATDDLGVELEGAHVVILGAGQMAEWRRESLLARPARLGDADDLQPNGVERAERLRDEFDDPRVAVGDAWTTSPHSSRGRDSSSRAVEVASAGTHARATSCDVEQRRTRRRPRAARGRSRVT